MTAVTVHVPHGGEGTRTLVLAVEVDEALLASATGERRIVERVIEQALGVLRDHRARLLPSDGTPCDTDGCDRPSLGGGVWCLVHFQEQADIRARTRRTRRTA